MSTQPYNKIDHNHCPEVDSPCGLKGKHRCCLCQEPVATQYSIKDFVNEDDGLLNIGKYDHDRLTDFAKQVEHQTILRCVEEICKEVEYWEKHSLGNYKDGAIEALDTAINKLQDLTK